jgi:hypothetical protein
MYAELPWQDILLDIYSCPHVNLKSLKILEAWKKYGCMGAMVAFTKSSMGYRSRTWDTAAVERFGH